MINVVPVQRRRSAVEMNGKDEVTFNGANQCRRRDAAIDRFINDLHHVRIDQRTWSTCETLICLSIICIQR